MTRFLRFVIAGVIIGWGAGCSTEVSLNGNRHDKYYSVVAENANFYDYDPRQGNAPEQKLARETLLTVVRPSFAYCKVRLLNGKQGYVASQDIQIASAALVAAATGPLPGAQANRGSNLRLNPNDPRLIAPPEPLPVDLPEPTPIPGTESSPTP